MSYTPDLDRLRFYREMQLWPISRKLNFENWLANFQTDEDKEIAEHILKFFVYIPDDMMTQLLQTVVGKCGHYFMSYDTSWCHDSFTNNCWYSFIQGENKEDRTDSGYVFIRMLHEELGVPNSKIVDFQQLISILECKVPEPQNVILVDDFVGTGAQCDTAWNIHKYGKSGKTLSEHVQSFHHRIAYAPLIVNEMGFKRIKKNCKGLHLEYCYKLSFEYSLFNLNGACWRGNNDMYKRWLDMLRRIAVAEGFPITRGGVADDVQGFGCQGLAIAFDHCIPDACPSIFYKETETWKPLKSRPKD